MATRLVSIIVPHLNDLDNLDRCLTALAGQDFDPAALEILVIDNGSTCGQAAVEACIAGRARLVTERRRGAGPARNRGVDEARGEYLAFTDADCLPRPDWLRRGIALLTPDNFVGGDVIVTAGNPSRPTVAEAYEIAFAFDIARYARRKRFVATANLFVTKPAFLAVGPFDSTVSEDTDWCWRANRSGYRLVFDPATAIEHPARDTEQSLAAKQTRVTRERFHLAMRWGSTRTGCALRALLAFASAPYELTRIRRLPISYWPGVALLHLRLKWRRCYETMQLCLAS